MEEQLNICCALGIQLQGLSLIDVNAWAPRSKVPPESCFVQASVVPACFMGLKATSPWGAAHPHGSVNYENICQFFLDQIARGITNTRFHEMEGSQTMIDAWRKAGLDSTSTYVGLGQLRYLGHLARLPTDRLERHFFFLAARRSSTSSQQRSTIRSSTVLGTLERSCRSKSGVKNFIRFGSSESWALSTLLPKDQMEDPS